MNENERQRQITINRLKVKSEKDAQLSTKCYLYLYICRGFVKSLIKVFKINFIVNTGDVCEDCAPVFNYKIQLTTTYQSLLFR